MPIHIMNVGDDLVVKFSNWCRIRKLTERQGIQYLMELLKPQSVPEAIESLKKELQQPLPIMKTDETDKLITQLKAENLLLTHEVATLKAKLHRLIEGSE